MKKYLLAVAGLMLSAASFAQMKVVSVAMTEDEGDPIYYYQLYDQAGFLVYAYTPGVGAETYTNDELGHALKIEVVSYLTDDVTTYEYTYNEQGLVASEKSPYYKEEYTYDAHGNKTMTMRTLNNGYVMSIPTTNTYDSNGHLIKTVTMGRIEVDYTYDEAGLLISEQSISDGVLQSTTTYTYYLNGSISTSRKEIPESTVTVSVYNYADIDVSYIPQNAFAVANPDNTVSISWSGMATEVVVDGQRYPVSGNSFTTPVLQDGIYNIYVVNNGNAAVLQDISVFDASKVGVSNVQLNGDIYGEWQTVLDRDGNEKQVMAYMFPIQWTLPDGANPIGYRIYYNSTYYVDLDEGTIRAYTVPATDLTIWSMSQGTITLPFEIRVIAIYATGQMEPANVISFTQEQTESIISTVGIQQPRLSTLNSQLSPLYDLSGRPASANARGIVIQRQGDTVRKVLKK